MRIAFITRMRNNSMKLVLILKKITLMQLHYVIQFITTLIIISFSSGLDSAFMTVSATSVWSSISFSPPLNKTPFYSESRQTLYQQFFYLHPKKHGSLSSNIEYKSCLLTNEHQGQRKQIYLYSLFDIVP